MDGTVLIADDDRTIRTVLTQALTRAGCKVHATSSLVTLLRWVEEGKGDLVISDVVMPDGNGLENLPKIAAIRPDLPVIVISAQNNIMTAIQAAEADAYDYLPKPFDLPDLMKRCARVLEAKRQPGRAPSATDRKRDLPLVGETAAMQSVFGLVARVMNTDLPVLITGENGTGKSLIGRIIHDFSDRRNLPLETAMAEDFATTDGPENLRLRAERGTLLFDEVGDFSSDAQARMVRLLDAIDEDGPRVLATSQKDLSSQMESGDFRKDLFYRLGGVTINVPPLRERVDDIALLAGHFLKHTAGQNGAERQFSPDAIKALEGFSWPGNVRQLENLTKRLAITCPQDVISAAETTVALNHQPVLDAASGDQGKLSECVDAHLSRYFGLHGGALPPKGLHGRILREIERPLIEISLEATGGNQAKCADLLGINRNTLRKKITELEIRVTRRRKLM